MNEDKFKQQVNDLIKEIASVLQMIVVYGPAHPKISLRLDDLFRLLEEALLIRKEIVIGIFAKEIIFEDYVFFSLSVQLQKFISELREKGIEKIIFKSGLTKEELSKFFNVLATKAKEIQEKSGAVKILAAEGVRNIVINKIYAPEGLGSADSYQPKELFENNYEISVDKAEDILREALKKELDYISLTNLIEQLVGLMDKNKLLFIFSSSVRQHDEYTFVHCVNVALLVMLQAHSLQLERHMVFNFGLAAFLHDVGKLTLSAQLLQKPSSLTELEFEEVKKHPYAGANIISKCKAAGRLPVIVAFEHHSHYDLNGYPKIDYANKPHLASQLTFIADYYDSLRSNRDYRKDYPSERVYNMMQKEAGKLFDPVLLNNFFKIIGVWPSGTVVELSNGNTGVVLENNPDDIFLPIVLVLYDSSGNKLSEPVFLNLNQQGGSDSQNHPAEKLSVLRSIYVEEKDQGKYLIKNLSQNKNV